MSRKKGRKPKPARLWYRRDEDQWIILYRGRQIRTGCRQEDIEGATEALKDFSPTLHTPTTGSSDPAAVRIADVLVLYSNSKDPGEDCTDIDAIRSYDDLCARVEMLLDWWGEKFITEVRKSACEEYVKWRLAQPRKNAKSEQAKAQPISVDTARRDLEDLRAAINAYHAEHVLTAVPVVTMPPKGEGRKEWLTRHQAARMLAAALGFVWDSATNNWKRTPDGRLYRRDRLTRARRRHAARFFLIGVYSARREKTIRRTQWLANTTGPWFDLDRMIYHGRGVEERKTNKRRPPAKIAYRLQPHLRRWRKMDVQWAASLRETGAIGDFIDVRHVVHRPDGRPLTGKIRTAWRGILKDACLGSEFKRHTLRHTAATWTMQKGTDLWTASGWLAMSIEVLERDYAHHHPDFQEEAAQAFGGRRS